MIRNYSELTRLEMEQIDREETIVLIPLGALEQHGNQAPLGTDDIIAQAMENPHRNQRSAIWSMDMGSSTAGIFFDGDCRK